MDLFHKPKGVPGYLYSYWLLLITIFWSCSFEEKRSRKCNKQTVFLTKAVIESLRSALRPPSSTDPSTASAASAAARRASNVCGKSRNVGRTSRAKHLHPSITWTQCCVVISVVLSVVCASGIGLVGAQKTGEDTNQDTSEPGICKSVDIRNSVQTFDRLRGCRVVEGFVQILLFDSAEESLYDNLTFPELTEITGYLLLYRVNGLRTLGNLFPNLAVIRGQTLFFNYAFVIFEMSSLREIGLYSLTDIVHGLVRIDKNPSLCYVNTIDWDIIAHEGKGEHFIKSNKLENECPICPGDDGDDKGINCPLARNKQDSLTIGPRPGRHLCWNQTMCQKVCPDGCHSCNENRECCNELCLGGCPGPQRNNCTVCRHLSFGSGEDKKCLHNCPSYTYEFMNRRCIYKKECFNQRRPPEIEKIDTVEDDERPYKAFKGSCLLECPPGYYETKAPDGYKTCDPCKNGMCKKECPGINVDSISSAKELRGCTHIKGSLEIQIRGSRNVVKELEENLNMIEEIDGYLKIVRSFPLISLNFLKKLKVIQGNTLENQKYAFVVLDNQNLQELWDWENGTRKLEIKNGRLFFHFNPKLCWDKIKKLQEIAKLSDFNDMEVATTSNGDKVACHVTNLQVEVSTIHSSGAVLKWHRFVMEDHRSLLGYVVYSIEAPSKNISLYDGRDACGGDGWKVDDVTNEDSEVIEIFHILTHLKPYTQYAFYVKTYTIATEKHGAQSKIQYLRTLPDVPSVPVSLRVFAFNDSTLQIHWSPPVHPNGNVIYYEITATWDQDDQKFLQQRNYCKEPLIPTPDDKKLTPATTQQQQIEETTVKESNESCACDAPTEKISSERKESEVMSQINFENELHNRVYIKRPEARRKREIEATKKRYSAQASQATTEQTNNLSTSKNNSANISAPYLYKKIIYNNTSCVLNDLHHFAKYTISIRACREIEQNEKGEENEKVVENCSTQSIVTQRTTQKADVDIVQNVNVEILNSNQSLGMVKLTWDEPPDPNGIILTYNIAYARHDKSRNFKKLFECITQQMFLQAKKQYILRDLHPGNYTVSVQVTTLAGDGNTTKEISFFIPETGSFYTTTIITIVVVFVILLIGGIGVHILYRKFFPSNVPNMKLIASVNPEYVSTVYVPDDWEVPRRKIEFIQELGQGSFGMVYEGIARDVVKGKPEIRCAIKTVNEHATDRERIEFLNEASVMKAFNTTHVVQLLGVVSQGQPTLVVMELMANGDLKSYLRSHRPDADSYNSSPGRYPPTLKRILQMAIEIADGMAYLAAKKFVHRDLAARNCMVAEDLTVKIGDFGMTRDIYETDYYRKGTKGLLPVRWMAPESLKDGVFTSSSDVWSYGVVLWEMATLASQPYQGLSNDQVLRYVIDGGIMERPENCPDKLYTLMRNCWQHKPQLRPSFLDLESMLLEDANSSFKNVSFYHSPAGVEARTLHNTAQDDPSTPLRSTKDIEDFSLGSGSDSEPESIGDDHVNSDIDGGHVTIDFPRFQAASFKDNQKSMDTSGPSLFSYKDDCSINANSGPSLCSFNEQPPITNSSVRSGVNFLGNDNREEHKKSTRLLNSIDNDLSANDATANGYVGNRPLSGTTNKTTQC